MSHAAARQRLHAVRAHASQADDHDGGGLHAVEAGAGHDDLELLGGRAAARADAQRLGDLLARTRRRSRNSRILAVHILCHAVPFAHAAKAAVPCFAFILASRTRATLQQQASSRKKGKRTQKPDVRTNPQTRRGQKPGTRVSPQVGRTKSGRARSLRPPRLPVTKPWWSLWTRWLRNPTRNRPWTPWSRCSTRSFPSPWSRWTRSRSTSCQNRLRCHCRSRRFANRMCRRNRSSRRRWNPSSYRYRWCCPTRTAGRRPAGVAGSGSRAIRRRGPVLMHRCGGILRGGALLILRRLLGLAAQLAPSSWNRRRFATSRCR